MFRFTTKKLARAGIIAGLYVMLSLVTFPVASGAIQFRVAEALTLVALFFPEAVLALTVGCALSNLITGCMVLDIIFGSIVTFLAGALTCVLGKRIKNFVLKVFVGGLFPVFLNALLLPVIWYFCYGQLEYMYVIQVLLLLAGQSVSVYALGVPMTVFIKKLKKVKPELFK